MLLRFTASNHRSIMGPVELSMMAVDWDRTATREAGRLNERVLTTAGIYGPNASGKSNVLSALAWLSAAVGRSLKAWDEGIPREPFKFGQGPFSLSTFAVELLVNGVRYVYELGVDDDAVEFEGLYSYPERRRRALFEREGMEIRFRRGLGSLSGTRELLTPTTLALSAASRLHESDIRPFAEVLSGMNALGLRSNASWTRRVLHEYGSRSTDRLFRHPEPPNQPPLFEMPTTTYASRREAALALLRFADLGINDVEIADDQELRFLHQVAGERVTFEPFEESNGTLNWFMLIGPVLHVLRGGNLLLFDEIDASLHPRLSTRLLELFQDPETNPHGAQLVFTTHDTSLLNHLNRDEVWLTEKGSDGATTLTALAEYGGDKVRRSLNLERAYLQGRFGAVPEPDQALLRRALGVGGGGA